MKKNLSRIMACLMACVLAFNIVAIPKAKAVALEGATVTFAPAILTMYMKATGVKFAASSAAAGSMAVADMIGGYAAATGTTASAVTSSIASGAVISTSGAIILGVAAVALLAAITAWAISEYKLTQEGGSMIYDLPTEWPDPSIPPFTNSWSPLKVYFRQSDNSIVCYMFSNQTNPTYDNYMYFDYENDTLAVQQSAISSHYYYATYSPTAGEWGSLSNICQVNPGHTFGTISRFFYSDFDIRDKNGNIVFAAEQQVSAEIDPNAELIPELLPSQQMTFDIGVGAGATPDIIADHVFNGLANDTLNPTYKIEDVGDSGGINPDGGGTTAPDASLTVGLLERIANACESLANKIFGGIESIFAPDPALMQEISAAFTDKFGFVSTLHNLGTDLLSIDASSAPPVVYIHLEDAEGSIYYGETCKALDMSWYARYKEDGDRIMSGFLWIGFLWLLFKRASAIINGAEMATDYGTDIHDGFRIRGERNGKRF